MFFQCSKFNTHTHKSSSVSGSLSFFCFLSGVYTTPSQKSHSSSRFSQPRSFAPQIARSLRSDFNLISWMLRKFGALRGDYEVHLPREGGIDLPFSTKSLHMFFHIHAEGDMDLLYIIYIYIPTSSKTFFFLALRKKPGFFQKTRFFRIHGFQRRWSHELI